VAAAGFIAFMAVALAFRIPIIGEAQRMGRRLDTRLRMALLSKLPRLTDRYFHSRPISDLADRSHSIQLTRLVPGMGLHFVQASCELLLTLGGILLLDPPSAPVALGLAGASIVVPALFQPVINERDLRVRNHGGALGRFYLDALIGLVPIRTHRAEAAVRHQHQSLLVEWARSSHRVIRASVCAGGVQSILSTGLASLLLVRHFLRADGVTGADLLLIYWALKLPAIGGTLTALAHQYPMQRNVLLRLLEPLSAPEQAPAAEARSADVRRLVPPSPPSSAIGSTPSSRGVAITIEEGTVIAAGHPILEQVSLHVRPGEHVAIVGLSGAGKSTLLGLLLGWHRLAAGQMTVDGNALTDQALDALRRRTAWVDPAVQVWNRSFLDNINYSSREPDPLRVAAAIDAAQLRGVLQRLPEGLQTSLGEGGALISGGEGQRVRLARALAQPGVALALLDEPFRGMDREQRATLLADARRHWQGATLLCVTHDVSETLAFERVLVIEGGRIIEDGAPACLAAAPSRYRALLDAETRVRERMWKGEHWRRVRVEQGAVVHTAGRTDAVVPPAGAVQWRSRVPR
jgi:ATP-binding cassette subfamily B protein